MSDSIWKDPRITAYVLNELSDSERLAFEGELKVNADLAAAVEEARGLTGQLEGWYAAEASARLDDQRRQSIVGVSSDPDGEAAPSSAAVTSQAVSEPAIGPRLTAKGVVFATAASLLLVLGGASWFAARQAAMSTAEMQLSAVTAQQEASSSLEGSDTIPAEKTETMRAMVEARGDLQSNSVVVEAEPSFGDTLALDALDAAGGQGAGLASSAPQPAPVEGFDRDQAVEWDMADESETLSEMNLKTAVTPLPQPETAAARSADGLMLQQPLGEAKMNLGGVDGDNKRSFAVAPQETLRRGATVTRRARGVAGPSASIEESLAVPGRAASPNPASGNAPMAGPGMRGFRTGGMGGGKGGLSVGRSPQQQPASAAQRPELTDLAISNENRDSRHLYRRQDQQEDRFSRGRMGIGGGMAVGGRFEPIVENEFRKVSEHALSTFSIDVDTASYSKTRNYLTTYRQLPDPNAVRIEELVNYFHYDYPPPKVSSKHPFAAHAVVTSCPWNESHRLARIALKCKVIAPDRRPQTNLVFLLDTSGSMDQPNKLPLVIDGMKMLLKQLDEDDRVAITVYAGSAGLVLESTPAKKTKKIRKALTRLSAGGSTNGGAGIALAYQTARDNFINDGVNRVILCTDGDFNVGTTGTEDLANLVEREAKGGIYLSVLAFGMDNHNDAMLEQISGRGNGNYAFIDTKSEARKVLVEQTNSTLVTIAKDVKLQIEFNPRLVSAYRLIGYENRRLAKEDFNDDKKDAGEIGAGHEVTALYEIVPAGAKGDGGRPVVDDLKYQQSRVATTEAADSDEMLTLKLRYKQPDSDTSTLVEFAVRDQGIGFGNAGDDVRFAAAVAGFGMQLRDSRYRGTWTLSDILHTANGAIGEDRHGLRAEFVELVRIAHPLLDQRQ